MSDPDPRSTPANLAAEARAAEEKIQREKRLAELAQLRADAEAIMALREVPGWIRLTRLLREQIELWREKMENPKLELDEIRALQWQTYALRWILEMPDTLRRKLETERVLDDHTVPATSAGPPRRGV